MFAADKTKKYGLILKAKKPEKTVLKKSVFDDDDSDGEASSSKKVRGPYNISRETVASKAVKKQAQLDIEKAMEEDPSVYEYDNIYENLQEKKHLSNKREKDVTERKPKYIGGLLRAAHKRQIDYERLQERLAQRDREKEGDMYNDKEEFVTNAFREKMELLKQAEEEERLRDLVDAKSEVTKQEDLTGFYRHMLTIQTEDRDKQIKEEDDIKREKESSPSGRSRTSSRESSPDEACDGETEVSRARAALRNLREMRTEAAAAEDCDDVRDKGVVPEVHVVDDEDVTDEQPQPEVVVDETDNIPALDMSKVVKLAKRKTMDELLQEVAKHPKITNDNQLSDARLRFLARKKQRNIAIADDDDK